MTKRKSATQLFQLGAIAAAFALSGAAQATTSLTNEYTVTASITLSNVVVGANTVGVSTYFGYGAATAQSTSNQYGNYSTFTGTFAAPWPPCRNRKPTPCCLPASALSAAWRAVARAPGKPPDSRSAAL